MKARLTAEQSAATGTDGEPLQLPGKSATFLVPMMPETFDQLRWLASNVSGCSLAYFQRVARRALKAEIRKLAKQAADSGGDIPQWMAELLQNER